MTLSELRAIAAGLPEPSAEEVAATVEAFFAEVTRPAREALRRELERQQEQTRRAIRALFTVGLP